MRDRDLEKIEWCLLVQAIPWAQSLIDADIDAKKDLKKARTAVKLLRKERERLKRNRERRAENKEKYMQERQDLSEYEHRRI